jgi:hypothetical protein
MATAARREGRVRAGVPWVQRLLAGVIGSIVGGLAFGSLMAMMGMLPMVASIVGSKSAVVGFIYHMFNSVVIGALFGLILGSLSRNYGQGVVFGLLYGVVGVGSDDLDDAAAARDGLRGHSFAVRGGLLCADAYEPSWAPDLWAAHRASLRGLHNISFGQKKRRQH